MKMIIRFCLALIFALKPGQAKARLTLPDANGTSSIVLSPDRISLDSLYKSGVEAMDSGNFPDAERRFLSVLGVDSNDYDARERLSVLYHWEDRMADRDRELSVLRGMQARSSAWRQFIWRDQFLLKNRRIMAVEILSSSPNHKRKYLFAVSDNVTGRFLYMVAMTRRAIVPPDQTVQTGSTAYEVEVSCCHRRKVYRLSDSRLHYAESVRILEKFMESI
jgi:hypothetical protein